MSITTKKGDRGHTSLYGGGRVFKDHPRIEACGTIDEVCAFLGLAKSLIQEKKTKGLLTAIQEDLLNIASELAAGPAFVKKLKKRITHADALGLEKIIEVLEAKIPLARGCFYIAGDNMLSSSCDIARTVTRRAERQVVTLQKKGSLVNKSILVYLNRLSDVLYLLARAYEKTHTRPVLKS